MACASFDPDLPVSNDVEKAAWLTKWKALALNDLCLQSACGHTCIGNDELVSESCRTCLETAQCSEMLTCTNCIGDVLTFDYTYDCTVPNDISTTVILVFVSIFLVLLILPMLESAMTWLVERYKKKKISQHAKKFHLYDS